jgi:hypothetical protein
MAKTDPDQRPGSVSDWFCGGHRRRLVLAALLAAPADGMTIAELQEKSGCGQATAYEAVRALRAVKLLGATESPGSYAVDRSHPLAKSLESWLDALGPFTRTPVERPRRGKRSS